MSAWRASCGNSKLAKSKSFVPAPALSEVLVTEGVDVQDVLTTLRGSAFIRIGDFDERAAVELAMRLRAAIRSGGPCQGMQITKRAMKFDRQIVAIALVNGALPTTTESRGSLRVAAWPRSALPAFRPAAQRELFEDAEGPAAGDNRNDVL